MLAVTVGPRRPLSARLEDIPEPATSEGDVLVETLAVGVCGTDREILDGSYGEAPEGRDRLVLGHESLGLVLEAPQTSDLRRGDLVAAIVRRPDPVPCDHCAVGEWDMCRNGRYTEHGIKGLDGFGRERFRTHVTYAVRMDATLGSAGVLLEPASIVAKAWHQIDRIGERSRWTPRRVLVLGAGPVGLLAALFGIHRRLDVHVLDRVTTGPKPGLVERLGAVYHIGPVAAACRDADIVLECTGAPQLVFDAMRCVAPTGIVCLTGVSSGRHVLRVDAGSLNNELFMARSRRERKRDLLMVHSRYVARSSRYFARMIRSLHGCRSWLPVRDRGGDMKVASHCAFSGSRTAGQRLRRSADDGPDAAPQRRGNT